MKKNILSPEIIKVVDRSYYSKIPKKISIEKIILDPKFIKDPGKHISLFTDHGTPHAWDTYKKVVFLMDQLNGVHFKKRNSVSFQFVLNLAAILAYIHDIGMINTTEYGRTIHPEYLAHEVFSIRFNKIIAIMKQKNSGGIFSRILNLLSKGEIIQSPTLILREILAIAYCHSKSTIPMKIIHSPQKLRKQMQLCLSHSLQELYSAKKLNKTLLLSNQNQDRIKILQKYYSDFTKESFQWMSSSKTDTKEFYADIIDAIRLVRSADVLRQRGTRLKTSSGFQIFLDQNTAKVIYALQNKKKQIFFLESYSTMINAGEANIKNLIFNITGDLYIQFYRGDFPTQNARLYALKALKKIVEYIVTEILENLGFSKHIYVYLENTSVNSDFIVRLINLLIKDNYRYKHRIKILPCLDPASAHERQYYLNAPILKWSPKKKKRFLQKVLATGHKIHHIDINAAFKDLRIIHLKKGDKLIEAGSYAAFVYVPLGKGLKGYPEGGYKSFNISPWQPFGNTGVIRGDIRNSTILVKKPVQLIMIPKEVYLNYWYQTYSAKELAEIFSRS